jgi:hypothetical protein
VMPPATPPTATPATEEGEDEGDILTPAAATTSGAPPLGPVMPQAPATDPDKALAPGPLPQGGPRPDRRHMGAK